MKPARQSKFRILKIADAATIMGVSAEVAASRLAALGYTTACSRCDGSGRHSYNQKDGDRCWGCNGRGLMLVPITEEIMSAALTRIAAGDLAPYFARNAARKSIGRKIKAFWAVYMASETGRAYTRLSMSTMPAGEVLASPECRAMDLLNAAQEAVGKIQFSTVAQDPIEACVKIDACVAFVAEVDAAWVVFETSRS